MSEQVTVNEIIKSINFPSPCKYYNAGLINRIKTHGIVPDDLAYKLACRFMGWKLPDDFNPDCGISFKKQHDYVHPEFGVQKYEPIGTNLFTLEQARAMFEYVLSIASEPEKA